MGIGVPFIFQILLLLFLPLAFAYLICLAALLVVCVRVAWKSRSHRAGRGVHDSS